MVTTQTPPLPPAAPLSPLELATHKALAALTDILDDADAPHRERRLAAVAILKHAADVQPKPPPREPAAKRGGDTRADAALEPDADAAQLAEFTEMVEIAYHRGYEHARADSPPCPPDPSEVILEQFMRRRELEYAQSTHPTDPLDLVDPNPPDDPHFAMNPPHA